jgi:hypothetical protein
MVIAPRCGKGRAIDRIETLKSLIFADKVSAKGMASIKRLLSKRGLDIVLPLLVFCILGVLIRYQNHQWLPEEQYFDGDSVRFARQAQIILERGELPEVD